MHYFVGLISYPQTPALTQTPNRNGKINKKLLDPKYADDAVEKDFDVVDVQVRLFGK
jgi:hypothetical protein